MTFLFETLSVNERMVCKRKGLSTDKKVSFGKLSIIHQKFFRLQSHKIMIELQQSRYKKFDDKLKFTSELLQLVLMLRYTSLPACQLLVKNFPLPSISLLKRLSQREVEPLKAVKLLLNKRKIDQDIVLLTDELYLQKEVHIQQGKLIGCDDNSNLFKGIMTFMIMRV